MSTRASARTNNSSDSEILGPARFHHKTPRPSAEDHRLLAHGCRDVHRSELEFAAMASALDVRCEMVGSFDICGSGSSSSLTALSWCFQPQP